MKKISIILLSILCPSSLFAQETLSLQQCREMALQYNKEMAASVKQTESALYTMKSYKGNFFPNFTDNGMGLYSTADGGFGIEGGKMPVILYDAAGNLVPTGIYTHFPGINLDYKVGTVYMGGIRVEQPLYMGGLPDVCLGERDGRDERGADGDGSDPQNRQSLCSGREGAGDEKGGG